LAIGKEEAFSRLDIIRANLTDALDQTIDSLVIQGHKEAKRVGTAITDSAKSRLGKLGGLSTN
jgi:hypothetical protein